MCILVSGHNINYVSEVICSILLMKMVKSFTDIAGGGEDANDKMADYFKVNFLGAVSWSFEFEDQPWFYGFRDLATNGVDKPVLNVFRMFGMMQGQRLEVSGNKMYPVLSVRDSSVRNGNDVGGLAATITGNCTVMTWNYHDDDSSTTPEQVAVKVSNLPAKKVTVTQYRVDQEHSNAYEVWKQMGSPQHPTKTQVTQLEKAGMLEILGKPIKMEVKDGLLNYNLLLPAQAVALLKMEWND